MTRTTEQRLTRLANQRKWYVGGGRRILWAPEFPVFLDRPGYWDPGTYLEIKLGPIFTYTILEDGHELPLAFKGRRWRPDRLVTRFGTRGLTAEERKTLTLDDTFRSELSLRNTSSAARTLDVILWGFIKATDTGDIVFGPVKASTRGIDGDYRYEDEQRSKRHDLSLRWTLDVAGGRSSACTSYAVQNSELTGETPDWKLSPFYELFRQKLPNTCQWSGGIELREGHKPHRKWVFIALHRRIRLAARKSTTLVGGCQVSAKRLKPQAGPAVPGWQAFFDMTPVLRCSDPYFEKYFDYRWYGLRLNTVDFGRRPLAHPCVFEGINPGWFRHAISYSAQILPRDCRWLHDPALARGCILDFLETQGEDGFIHGGLLTEEKERAWHAGLMFHGDWGGAVRAVHEVHPDRRFLKTAYTHLGKYADWFDRARDADGTGLYDVCSQAETGQEYMSRYLFVDPKADEWGTFRLKGIDATVYVYILLRELAWMAGELGRDEEASAWHGRADRTRAAVRDRMWDAKLRKFCDIDPRSGARSPVKALTDFYPFLTDIADAAHLVAIRDHLLNPKEFWTEWPAPSTSLDDRTADPYGRWLGKRHCCPWNGRTWLMTNSHIAEGLARAALELDPSLEPYAVTFITRFIHMLFVDRDLDWPTSYEYYNPLTGQAPFFRGVDDYMHSAIIDPIIKYVVGLRPHADGTIMVQPLQFGLKRFSLENVRIAGQPARVSWDGKRLSAQVGRRKESRPGWGALALEVTK